MKDEIIHQNQHFSLMVEIDGGLNHIDMVVDEKSKE